MATKPFKNKKKINFSPTAQLITAVSLFVIATLLSRGEPMTPWEKDVFLTIYNWPNFLHPPFWLITQLGSIYMLGVLLAFYMFGKHYHTVLRLLLTGALAYMAAGVAKDLWGRDRPYQYLVDVVSLEYVVRGPGFPSGHMALATALAFTVGHYVKNKEYRWLLALALIGVGLSRIYLGVHAPLDIVGGFAIGWAAYALFRNVRLYDVLFANKKPRDNNKSKKSK